MILRVLANAIDVIIVFIPSYMLLTMMSVEGKIFNLLPQLFFVIYNVIMTSSFNGKTVGKYFSRLSVHTEDEGALQLGVRETAKLLYFVPLISPLAILFTIPLFLFTGKFLHDWIGSSQVVFNNE
jgi:hypothetical protein